MTKVLLTVSTIAAVALSPLAASTSFAAEPGVGYGGSVGALADVTRGLATTPEQVRAQGGFATAGTVRWIAAPATREKVSAASF